MTQAPNRAPLLEMRHISKSFPGVRALDDVSLQLGGGEVLALVGENGAGKSTLIKVLGGVHLPDSGQLWLDGTRQWFASPSAAQRAGISIIFQEFNLIPELSVRENIFLGREQTRWGMIRGADEQREVVGLLRRIGLDIDVETRCADLTVAEQQQVEIAKALSLNARIVVMDEPTAALAAREVERLFAVIQDLKAHGIGILYISHRLDEIFHVADCVMVLRDGQRVGYEPIGKVTRETLIERMVGRPIDSEFPTHAARPGLERLRVEHLRRGGAVRDVSFSVRAGEILGLAGLAGAGRTEAMRLVFGADPLEAGRIYIDGQPVRIRSPRDAIRHRICLLTEDRKAQGLVLQHSVRENFGLPNLDRYVRRWLVDQRLERRELADYVARLRIKITDPDEPAANLSGGNQQKVVLAKWLAGQADIFVFDEPTRGIDVGAKYEIYLLMNRLAEEGRAVVMISSDLPEILGMSDRIVVMHEGRVKGEITDVASATQQQILAMAMA